MWSDGNIWKSIIPYIWIYMEPQSIDFLKIILEHFKNVLKILWIMSNCMYKMLYINSVKYRQCIYHYVYAAGPVTRHNFRKISTFIIILFFSLVHLQCPAA